MVAVLVETEPVLLEKLSENGQLDLLYDMEQPLALVLAKMEIAGIKVKKKLYSRCKLKMSLSLKS